MHPTEINPMGAKGGEGLKPTELTLAIPMKQKDQAHTQYLAKESISLAKSFKQ